MLPIRNVTYTKCYLCEMLTIRNVTNTTNKMLPLRKVTSSTNKMLPIRNVTSTTNKMLPIKMLPIQSYYTKMCFIYRVSQKSMICGAW